MTRDATHYYILVSPLECPMLECSTFIPMSTLYMQRRACGNTYVPNRPALYRSNTCDNQSRGGPRSRLRIQYGDRTDTYRTCNTRSHQLIDRIIRCALIQPFRCTYERPNVAVNSKPQNRDVVRMSQEAGNTYAGVMYNVR